VNENLPFFPKVKVQFQDNSDILYGICSGLALSIILIIVCCCWLRGSSSASPEKKEASSLPEETGEDKEVEQDNHEESIA
jgi:hypothetical protein